MIPAPNITVNVYRGFDAEYPYPLVGQAPAVAGVAGFLRHHVEAGRFGYQTRYLYWTHLLYVPLGTDVRSAYDTQLDPARNNANADTVCVADYPLPGQCTCFFVVHVQRDRVGGFLRVYLDRLRPRQGGCFASPGNQGCCPKRTVPATVYGTVRNDSGCACMDGAVLPFTYNPILSAWEYENIHQPGCPSDGQGMSVVHLALRCQGLSITGWTLENAGAAVGYQNADPSSTCTPFNLVFKNFHHYYDACAGGVIDVTITL